MVQIFYRLYQYINKNKLSFTAGLVVLIGCLCIAISQLNLKEDTSALLPNSDQLKLANEVLQASGLSDKMVLMVHSKDQSPEQLIASTNLLINNIDSTTNSYILEYKLGDQNGSLRQIYQEIILNLPLLVDSSDLNQFKVRLDSNSISASIEAGYKRMLSPAGMVWKEPFLNDPLGLAGVVLKKLQNLQGENGLTLHQGYLMDAKKETIFVFLKTKYGSNETSKNARFLKLLNADIASFQKTNQETEVSYYGAVSVAVGNANQIKRDINITVTAALFFLSLFFAFYFRNIIAFLIVFLPAAIGAMLAIGIIAISGHSIAVISLGIGAVLLGITVDYSLHVLIHLKAYNSKEKLFKDLTSPILMSSITTAIAFFCLKIINTKAISDLGLFAGISVIGAAIATLIIIPQLYKPNKKSTNKETRDPFSKLANLPYHSNKYWLSFVLIITIVLAIFVPKVSFMGDMEALNFQSKKTKLAENLFFNSIGDQNEKIFAITQHQNLDSAINLNEQFLDNFQKTTLFISDYKIETVQDFLISESIKKERIETWNSFWEKIDTDVLEQNINDAAKQFNIKPGTFDAFLNRITNPINDTSVSGQLTNLEHLILEEYLFNKDDKNYIINIITTSRPNIPLLLDGFHNSKHTQLINLKEAANSYVSILKTDLNKLGWLTFIILFVILLLLFGRIELATLTIIPIIISWIWTLGLLGLFNIPLNITNIIITTFVFGLGIDYAIFITKGILQQYIVGENMLVDYKKGIYLSCITTLIGLGSLIFAQHPALKSIALVSIIGILSTVIITTTILPFLLKNLLFNRPANGNRPYTFRIFATTSFAYFYFVFGCFLLTLLIFIFKITPISKKYKKSLYHNIMYAFISSLVYMMFHIKKKFINLPKDKSPAIYIVNHQSFLDILFILLTHPKMIILTNEWVWNSPFFGRVVQYADFYPVAKGVEESVSHLQKLVNDGYSIVIFPEGTRSKNNNLGRFKKGAFYLAEKLNLDIIPVIFHGTGDCIRKNDFMINSGFVTIKYLNRIKISDISWGDNYNTRAKSIRAYYKKMYTIHRAEKENTNYFEKIIDSNYLYKGTILPLYVKIKIKLANNFKDLNEIVPKDGLILNLGCGYGYMDYILHLTSANRNIIGYDYDIEKVKIATNNYSKNANINFVDADILKVDFPKCDSIIIWDVLHYLSDEEQLYLLDKCSSALKENGQLIIREGNDEDEKNHSKTKLTEWFSTTFGFNKIAHNNLSFIGVKMLQNYASSQNYKFTLVNKSSRTSNQLILLEKTKQTIN